MPMNTAQRSGNRAMTPWQSGLGALVWRQLRSSRATWPAGGLPAWRLWSGGHIGWTWTCSSPWGGLPRLWKARETEDLAETECPDPTGSWQGLGRLLGWLCCWVNVDSTTLTLVMQERATPSGVRSGGCTDRES